MENMFLSLFLNVDVFQSSVFLCYTTQEYKNKNFIYLQKMYWLAYLSLILVVITFIFFVYQIFLLLEDKVLFVPIKEHIWTPTSQYTNIMFTQNSEQSPRLHAWYLPIDQEKKQPVVLFCHGNTGNISHRKYVVDLCREMHLSLFLFDYQGYGQSEGKTTLNGLKEDGEAAYNYLQRLGYSSDQIIVWGESLGGLVATHIASKYPCSRLLLMATFADLPSLATESSCLLGKIAYPFLSLQGESNLEKIRSITTPILIIHSIEDEIIPYSHAERLYTAINHPWKKFFLVKGGHGTPQLTPDIIEEVMRFCWQEPHVTPECLDILNYVATTQLKHGR